MQPSFFAFDLVGFTHLIVAIIEKIRVRLALEYILPYISNTKQYRLGHNEKNDNKRFTGIRNVSYCFNPAIRSELQPKYPN